MHLHGGEFLSGSDNKNQSEENAKLRAVVLLDISMCVVIIWD